MRNDIGEEIFIAAIQGIGYFVAAVTFPVWILPFLYNRRRDKS